MKMKVIAILLMLTLMAFLPFAAARIGSKNETESTISTADNAKDNSYKENNTNEDKVLCGLVAAMYKNDYSTETIKAITILLNNNYSVSPNEFDLKDSSVCLYIESADNYIREIYPQIKKIVSDSKEPSIYFDNQKQFVPYSQTSNGNTVYNEKYDYISSAASPWDCFSEEYDKKAECNGVSIDGLNYLCKNGMSAEDALRWYLPKCEIK